jgi:hypothetical protein
MLYRRPLQKIRPRYKKMENVKLLAIDYDVAVAVVQILPVKANSATAPPPLINILAFKTDLPVEIINLNI